MAHLVKRPARDKNFPSRNLVRGFTWALRFFGLQSLQVSPLALSNSLAAATFPHRSFLILAFLLLVLGLCEKRSPLAGARGSPFAKVYMKISRSRCAFDKQGEKPRGWD